MERLTKYVTPAGLCMTSLNSMEHYMPCVTCRNKAEIKTNSKGKLYTEKFSFCDNCEVKILFNRLKEYEDAEENGMLIHLPCRVGDTVYLIDHNICRNRKNPLECTIDEFTVDHSNECYAVLNGSGKAYYAMRRFRAVNIKNFGKTVFLTREAAEQALAKMGE